MGAESDPPRKIYQLKPKEFERVNPAPAESAAPESASPGTPPTTRGPIDVRELARQASAGAQLLKGNAPANRATDIHELLRQNHERATAQGLNDVAAKPKRASKRKRDYILTSLIGNGLLLASLAIQPIFAAAGIIIFNLGLTWIMWFVMDDY
jgi:hypothetical protein